MMSGNNPVLEVIYKRRAVRKFKDDGVSVELIDAIVSAGRMAPSAINKQPWRFYIIQNKEHIAELSHSILSSSKWQLLKAGVKEAVNVLLNPSSFKLRDGIKFMNEEDPIFHGAPLVILLTAPKNNEWAALDIGMCAQNMMLTATSFGIASCPVGLAKFIENTNEPEKLGISDSETILLAIILGYADEEPELHARKTDNVIYVD